MAASSLTDVAPAVAAEAGVADQLTFSFAGSSSLVAQLAAGAPAEVLVTADADTMARAVDEGLVAGEVHALARNRLVLVTPTDGGADVTGIGDLADPELVVGLCAPEVPCGALARRVLEATGLTVHADTLEPNVRSLTTKVALGELDAALVYATEARWADVAVVDDPVLAASDLATTYEIALVHVDAPAPARVFVDTATGPAGRRVLAAAGFDVDGPEEPPS